MSDTKRFMAWLARTALMGLPFVVIFWLVCSAVFGETVRRKAARYKIAPTNCVVRIDGTNCYVRYMRDTVLNTNLVILCEPFDPPPAPSENENDTTNEEAENED